MVPLDLDRPTADFTAAPAMTEKECVSALSAGAEAVGDADLLVLGEMGIGNSTAAAALAAASFGRRLRSGSDPAPGSMRRAFSARRRWWPRGWRSTASI